MYRHTSRQPSQQMPRSASHGASRAHGVNREQLRSLHATLTLLKVAELRILATHLRLSKSGIKAELTYRIADAVAKNPHYYKPVVTYITRRDLVYAGGGSGVRRAPVMRRATAPYAGQSQQAYSTSQYHTQQYAIHTPQPPAVQTTPRTASEEAYRVAADYLDRLATRDPFVEKVATVLRVAIFKMPELYQKFEVSETLMSLIRSGMTCRLTCLELTTYLDKEPLAHSWPTNAKLHINNKPAALLQKHVQNGKVKTKSMMERPASIETLVGQGVNTFRMSGEPNEDQGDWPFGICITIVRPRKLTELMDKMRKKNTLTLEMTLAKIKALYHEDSDIVTEKLSVSLRDPFTMTRIKIPARGRLCNHLGCFDLETFLKFQRDAKHAQWKCALCDMGPLTLKNIVIDKWMEDVLEHCRDLESVFKVDVFEDGKYTPVFSEEDSSGDPKDNGEEPPNSLKRKLDGIKTEDGVLFNEPPPAQRQASMQSLGNNYDDAIELD